MSTLKLFTVLLLVLAVASVGGVALAQPPAPEIEGGEIVASGLSGPQGVLVDPDGNIWVIDSGLGGDQELATMPGEDGEEFTLTMGNTAQIAMITPDGEVTTVANIPSVQVGPEETSGGARLTLHDGTLYATVGAWLPELGEERAPLAASIAQVDAGGTVTEVANTWDLEVSENSDGFIVEAHPYGMTAGPDGWLYIADAGANTVLRVDPASGDVELVAAFAEGFPGGFPNPSRDGAVEADPVPTGVAFDDDGNLYVSFLTGAPFIPGTAKVMQITPSGEISDYATGLTTLTDLTFGPDGELYAVSFGIFGEQGPDPTTGAVIRIGEGEESLVVASGLPFPTGIAFDDEGNGYVTIFGVGAPGSGAVVRFDGLTDNPGEPLPMMGE